MNVIIERCRLAGIRLWVEEGTLRYDAPKGAMTPGLRTGLKARKAELMAALGQPPASKPRGLDGYGPGALSGTRMAAQIRSMPADDPVIGAGMARKDLDDIELEAVKPFGDAAQGVGVPGVSHEFQARLSPEDTADIAARHIPAATVQTFQEAAVARESQDLREHFSERSAILQADAGMSRDEAELEAGRLVVTYARNKGCLWASLRKVFGEHRGLLARIPDADGQVDALVLGVAKVGSAKGPARGAAGGVQRGPCGGPVTVETVETEARPCMSGSGDDGGWAACRARPSCGVSPSVNPAAGPSRSIPPPATPCPSGQPTQSATKALGAS
jgi:hypothetical protein